MVACGIAKSKSNARTLVQQGSIMVNGDKVTDIGYTLSRSDAYDQEFTILKKGKKNWYVVTFWIWKEAVSFIETAFTLLIFFREVVFVVDKAVS